MPNIPAGYQLHVTTWENDGDDYNTQITSGLSDEDVRFLLAIATPFEHGHANGVLAGNQAIDEGDLITHVTEVLAQHPNISPELAARWTIGDDDGDEQDLYWMLCQDLLGSSEEDGMFARVFQSFQVFHFEQPVEDVSAQFVF